MRGGYFWKGCSCRGKGRQMSRRGETVIHSSTISERMVKIVFAAGDSACGGVADMHSDLTQVCNLTGPPSHHQHRGNKTRTPTSKNAQSG